MFHRRLTICLGVALLAVLAAVPASAQSCSSSTKFSKVSFNFHNPITITLYDACTAGPGYDKVPGGLNPDPNAFVTLGGEFFYEWECTTRPNGDYHLEWTSHYNVTGTKNGIKYIGKDTQKYDLKMDPDGTFPPVQTSDFRTSDRFKLIAQGPTPDMVMTQRIHVRVDALGNIKIDHEGPPVIKCTGREHECDHH